jgi:hypothetical protein
LPYADARRRMLDDFERRYAEAVLAAHGGKVAAAARAAGVARYSFYRLLRRGTDVRIRETVRRHPRSDILVDDPRGCAGTTGAIAPSRCSTLLRSSLASRGITARTSAATRATCAAGHGDADDLMQDALVAALTRREPLVGDLDARAWLTTVMRHRFVDGCRRRATRRKLTAALDAVPPTDDDDATAAWWRDLDTDAVRAQLAALPPALAAPFAAVHRRAPVVPRRSPTAPRHPGGHRRHPHPARPPAPARPPDRLSTPRG